MTIGTNSAGKLSSVFLLTGIALATPTPAHAQEIKYGTDAPPLPEMCANYFCWLETEDEYFPYWDYTGQGRWKIYGLGLPDGIPEKVYHGNAEKIFAQFGGGK